MRGYSRREALKLLASFGGLATVQQALGQVHAATPASATRQRITRFEVIPVRVHMHERVREVFAEVYRQQGINRDYYDSTLVKLYTDEGLVGVGDALLNVEDSLGSVPKAEAICKRLIGHTPWEFLMDDSLGGILMAVYDLIGQAAGLPVSRLLAPDPKSHIVQTWWSQCFPPDLMASEAKLGYDLGYRVHKVKARDFEDPVEQAEAVTSNVPDDFRIWADTNSSWGTPERAISMQIALHVSPNTLQSKHLASRTQSLRFDSLRASFLLSWPSITPRTPCHTFVKTFWMHWWSEAPLERVWSNAHSWRRSQVFLSGFNTAFSQV